MRSASEGPPKRADIKAGSRGRGGAAGASMGVSVDVPLFSIDHLSRFDMLGSGVAIVGYETAGLISRALFFLLVYFDVGGLKNQLMEGVPVYTNVGIQVVETE